MATDQQVSALIQQMELLMRTIRDSGSLGIGSDLEHTIEAINETAKSTEELEKQTDKLRKNLQKSNTQYAKNIKTVADLSKVHRIVSKDFMKDFAAAQAAFKKGIVQGQEVDGFMEKYGMTIDDLNKSSEEMLQVQNDYRKAVEKTSESISSGRFSLKGAVDKTAVGFGLVAGAANAVATPLRAAAQFGTRLETIDLGKLGMGFEDAARFQADLRQAMEASGHSFSQFNETITDGSRGLTGYTASLAEAVRLQAVSYEQAAILGAERDKYQEQQINLFKRLNKGLSVTAQEFIELNDQLMNSHDVQSNLYRLNVRQRAAYIMDLQNTYEKLRLDGATHEQAQRMLETFAEIGAKSPRERLKEAAKFQAVMGATGMGGIGTEGARLIRTGARGPGEKERLAEILREGQQGMAGMMGQGFAQEMMAFQMIESTGLEKLLGPNSAFSSMVTRETLARDEGAYRKEVDNKIIEGTEFTNEQIGTALSYLDSVNVYLGQDIFGVLKTIAGYVATMALGGAAGKLAKGMFGGAKRGLGAAGGFAAKHLGKIGLGQAALKVGGALATGARVATPIGLATVAVEQGMKYLAPELHQKTFGVLYDKLGDFFGMGSSADDNAKKQNDLQEESNQLTKRKMESDEAFQRRLLEHTERGNMLTEQMKKDQQERAEREKEEREEDRKAIQRGYRISRIRAPVNVT